MATVALLGENVPPDIFYKCHPKEQVKAVMCLICDNVYHKSDFERTLKKGAMYISKVLVICDEHKDITLKDCKNDSENTENLKIALAHLRFKCAKLSNSKNSEKFEEVRSKQGKDSQSQELTSLKSVISIEQVKNKSLFEQNKILLEQNSTLKELNEELKEKNVLQKELLQERKSMSFANVASSGLSLNRGQNRAEKNNIPKIIAEVRNKECTKIVTDQIKSVLRNNAGQVPLDLVSSKNSNKIVIKCKNNENVDSIHTMLSTAANDMFRVKIEKKNDPLIKVVGVESDLTDYEDIKNEIITKNNLNENLSIEIKYIYSTKKQTKTIIMQVNADAYKYLIQEKRIYIGYKRCMIYDEFNMQQCQKCAYFGHSTNKCRNNVKCFKCAGGHLTKDCDKVEIKCINCLMANKKLDNKRDTNHTANEFHNCESYKTIIGKVIDKTNYPFRPILK